MASISSTTFQPWIRRSGALLAGLLLALSSAVLLAVPAEASSHAVKIQQYAYGPAALSIAQGDTVTWTNLDTVEHDVTVTSGPVSFRSPMLSKGQSWSYTFSTPGSYSYICSVHPDMHGSVTVAAAPPPTQPTPPTQPPTMAPVPTTQQVAPVAPGSQSPAGPKKGKAGRPASAAPAAAPQPAYAAPAAVQPPATLSPLLLVAGASIAVVVFCLLLMASRPQPRPSTTGPTES